MACASLLSSSPLARSSRPRLSSSHSATRNHGVHARLSGTGRIALDTSPSHCRSNSVCSGMKYDQTEPSLASKCRKSRHMVAGSSWELGPSQNGACDMASTLPRSASMPGARAATAAGCKSRGVDEPYGTRVPFADKNVTEGWLCETDIGKPFQDGRGLGALQPDGRAEVLQQCSESMKRLQKSQVSTAPRDQQRNPKESLRNSLQLKSARVKGIPAPELEWSSLNMKSKKAIAKWVSGGLGGRHCLMVLEYDAAIGLLISPLDRTDVSMSDLKGNALLSALSGLAAETNGHRDGGGYLYTQVFSKNPADVLEEAIQAALDDASDRRRERSGGFSVEQINLSLRRHTMNSQSAGLKSLLASTGEERSDQPRCSEEYLKFQIWLELVRLHVEGGAENSPQGVGKGLPASAGLKLHQNSQATSLDIPCRQQQQWDDRRFAAEMSKPETDLETEAQQMNPQALRTQNRAIEAYLMRLVRQRDLIKDLTRLAEQCDSYLILGLDGPEVSEDEVKRAYRTLARKEHPDKAGTENKERFQEIQQAYAAVLAQRRSVAASDDAAPCGTASTDSHLTHRNAEISVGATTKNAAQLADMAREAADVLTTSAHCSFELRSRAADARGLQKKAALRELQDLTKRASALLRCNAGHMRALHESTCKIARCADTVLAEYGEWSERAMAGAGLKERSENLQAAGESCLVTAEHLGKMIDSDHSMLQMIGNLASGVDITCAIRMLSESLSRTATVCRCTADKAINVATTALELSCSLAALDRQYKCERAQEASMQRPQSGPDFSPSHRVGTEDTPPADDPVKPDSPKDELSKKHGRGDEDNASVNQHVQASLRVQNLKCLSSLNEEVLALQTKLRSLLLRGEGLLPAVATTQKGGVFDLVWQLLQAGLAEANRLAVADTALPARKLIEQAFSFVAALELADEVAMPSEVKTQVLKLAALLDVDLLCQIIEGPFKQRLLSVGARRSSFSSMAAGNQIVRTRSGSTASAGGAPETWVEAVEAFCERMLKGLKSPLSRTNADSSAAQKSGYGST